MHNCLTCWHCKKEIDSKDVTFRSSCDHCFSDQHVCKNCEHYVPGKPNDCDILTTEPVKDRCARNFCENFKVRQQQSSQNQEKAKKLFGEDLPPKKIFQDLFK